MTMRLAEVGQTHLLTASQAEVPNEIGAATGEVLLSKARSAGLVTEATSSGQALRNSYIS